MYTANKVDYANNAVSVVLRYLNYESPLALNKAWLFKLLSALLLQLPSILLLLLLFCYYDNRKKNMELWVVFKLDLNI